MGNISYSVTDVCYNFYRSSSPFNATSAYYTGNEKEQINALPIILIF